MASFKGMLMTLKMKDQCAHLKKNLTAPSFPSLPHPFLRIPLRAREPVRRLAGTLQNSPFLCAGSDRERSVESECHATVTVA